MEPNQFSVYCEGKGENGSIDLGLSLRTLQPEVVGSIEGYGEEDEHGMNWGAADHTAADLYMNMNININMKHSNNNNGVVVVEQDYYCCEEEEEAEEVVQSKQQRWAYVKVNMDGVIVGRKVCIFQHGSYSSLALQLEDMFGRQCESGLKLFENESEFSLFYKDGDENWRSVGDVPWKQFVEDVKRLRIARKDEGFVAIHQN
ncbi:auxin-responsive protein IAA32-like isoform X2 [Cucurbita maxima]|uniref:Auxin-responsive protein n=1 Tax=Cucurbita maxima TaxID=3661 RepID=A0A6J1J6Y8_CUCMA|nr:auxin-responsive protein IAA32-like isoform X2 [Cucurbita maxima]